MKIGQYSGDVNVARKVKPLGRLLRTSSQAAVKPPAVPSGGPFPPTTFVATMDARGLFTAAGTGPAPGGHKDSSNAGTRQSCGPPTALPLDRRGAKEADAARTATPLAKRGNM